MPRQGERPSAPYLRLDEPLFLCCRVAQRITDVRRQNGHYNRSTSNTEGLAKTVVNGKKARKPAKEVATRWNSTLTVLARWYSTAPHQRANRDKCIKAIRAPSARAKAKNPVTDELIKVVGQTVTVGLRVLECTARCESNSVTLLSAGATVLSLYKTLKQTVWLMPTSPDDVVAVGRKDIEAVPRNANVVLIDDTLFKAAPVPREVLSPSPSCDTCCSNNLQCKTLNFLL